MGSSSERGEVSQNVRAPEARLRIGSKQVEILAILQTSGEMMKEGHEWNGWMREARRSQEMTTGRSTLTTAIINQPLTARNTRGEASDGAPTLSELRPVCSRSIQLIELQ